MKDAEKFDEIQVVMDIVQYRGKEDKYAGKFLVLKKASEYRENRQRYAENPWEIPGGKIEFEPEKIEEDHVRQEGLRELYEETRLFAAPEETGPSYGNRQEGVEITFYPIRFIVKGSPEVKLDPAEHESFEWISEEEFRDRMTENEIEALERVQPM